MLAPDQLERIFQAVCDAFEVAPAAEITVECAPGTISDGILETLIGCGVNRVSLGVQSFVDKECSSVGRLHTRKITLADIARLAKAGGIGNISIDLIVSLPHQTQESWNDSLTEILATGVPHVSVYMLEVDEDSASAVSCLQAVADTMPITFPTMTLRPIFTWLHASDSVKAARNSMRFPNFARPVTHGIGLRDSRHNLKYWTRQPYLGFGVDAHSMLRAGPELVSRGVDAVRLSTPDSLEGYSAAEMRSNPAGSRALQLKASCTLVDAQAALEESFFLGLRLNRGVCLDDIHDKFGSPHSTRVALSSRNWLKQACWSIWAIACASPREGVCYPMKYLAASFTTRLVPGVLS